LWQHLSRSIEQLSEEAFEEGFGMDGSFAAMMMAGLDGVENKIDPGQPLDKDIYDLGPEELAKVSSMPSRRCMHGELLSMYTAYKRTKEVGTVRLRPHPYEFALCYDI
jgi:glutamine synthetase